MTERPAHPKTHCAIVGCRRWSRRYPPGSTWICADHWRLVSRQTRALLRRLWRRLRDTWPAGTQWDDLPGFKQSAYRYLDRLERRVWARAVRRVTEHEAGL